MNYKHKIQLLKMKYSTEKWKTKNTQFLFSLPTKKGGSVPLNKLRFILSIKI